jgi:hypothetical protein
MVANIFSIPMVGRPRIPAIAHIRITLSSSIICSLQEYVHETPVERHTKTGVRKYEDK